MPFTEKTKYRLWLKVRVGKFLDTPENALTASIAGRTITVESERRQQPLSEASWLVIGCRDFETEDQAREFGEELRRAAHLAGLCTRMGVDAGDPGEDRTVSWVNPEMLGIGRGKYRDLRLGSDVHGVVVLPDDGNTVFFRASQPTVTVLSSADHFVGALEEASLESDAGRSGSPSIRRAIRILNLAEMNEDPIAKVVLAVSTVEGLANDPPWTEGQSELIERAAVWLEQDHSDGEEAEQVINAIRQVRRESIRQRVKRLLEANNLSSVWDDWNKLYKRRSSLFHGRSKAGGERQGSHLEKTELHRLGQEATKLCARIVLSVAKREGIAVPDRARAHFGVE